MGGVVSVRSTGADGRGGRRVTELSGGVGVQSDDENGGEQRRGYQDEGEERDGDERKQKRKRMRQRENGRERDWKLKMER